MLAADPPYARGVLRLAALLTLGGVQRSALRCAVGG
jgi:hypothetical protein